MASAQEPPTKRGRLEGAADVVYEPESLTDFVVRKSYMACMSGHAGAAHAGSGGLQLP